MARVKDWMIDMESAVYDAIEKGFSTYDDVIAYVNTVMRNVDRGYVREVLENFNNPDWDYAGWE